MKRDYAKTHKQAVELLASLASRKPLDKPAVFWDVGCVQITEEPFSRIEELEFEVIRLRDELRAARLRSGVPDLPLDHAYTV